MGGLLSRMPITGWTFIIGGLALSGFPLLTAGFWSKDEILSSAWSGQNMWVFWTLAVAAFLTAFYTARQISLTFLGAPRTERRDPCTGECRLDDVAVDSDFPVCDCAGLVRDSRPLSGIGGIVPNWLEHFLEPYIEYLDSMCCIRNSV